MTESEASMLTITSKEHGKADQEVAAIFAIVAALKPLKEHEVKNVLEYVLRRFGAGPLSVYAASQQPSPAPQTGLPSYSTVGVVKDVRSLREEKAPKSANEMAALVAFYVSELAPAAERKPEINKTDVERYFKTAGFKLTPNAGQTLVNAKNAGYLDAGSDAGYYRLNPVGYNLVVHRLGSTDASKRSIRSSKKTGRKKR